MSSCTAFGINRSHRLVPKHWGQVGAEGIGQDTGVAFTPAYHAR